MKAIVNEELNDWGKILSCKFLATSKSVHVLLITTVPHAIINQLNNIPKIFTWNRKKKVKHSTFLSGYKNGSLKDIHVFTKAWIKR